MDSNYSQPNIITWNPAERILLEVHFPRRRHTFLPFAGKSCHAAGGPAQQASRRHTASRKGEKKGSGERKGRGGESRRRLERERHAVRAVTFFPGKSRTCLPASVAFWKFIARARGLLFLAQVS